MLSQKLKLNLIWKNRTITTGLNEYVIDENKYLGIFSYCILYSLNNISTHSNIDSTITEIAIDINILFLVLSILVPRANRINNPNDKNNKSKYSYI